MEVFNKLYSQVSSSVSSTVSQLSGVLPGNPVTREFDAVAHIASAGPGLLWKIYKGNKRSTKQEASIFVFEKRQLDKWSKSDRELVLETLRRGIIQLTKIRHPQVLIVQHALEESRESLAFATEPVFASLANVLGKTHNMPQPANMSDYKLYDVEIKYGLLQVSEGLAFLHNDVKLVHKNIAPETVVINKQGAWKIFGFDFCVHNTSPPNSPPFYPYDGYSPGLPDVCQPSLDYMAPECVLTQSHGPASDMFSLGMLAYALHSPGNQVIGPGVKDVQQFKSRAQQQLKNLNLGKLQCVPEALREYVKLLLNVTPEVRPDAHQFVRIPYFDDVGVKTLNYLDSLLQWDNLQKSQFYKGLPEALPKLPQRVKVQRVLACLSRDLAQPQMVPFVLPSILDIAQECTKEEYCQNVLPYLKPVMKMIEPVQILLIMLQRMELLLKLTPAEDVQQHVLPMLYRGLDSDISQVHELCLNCLPTFAGLLDHSNVKNSLLPRIKKLCLSTSSLSVRVNCLLCVGRLLEHLDKWLVLDEVLPFLPQIPSREPAVLMGILGIYKLAMNHKKLGISKEVIATRILPFLMPLCIENGLTLTQFNALVTLVKEMFSLVETEHRNKLEQLNQVKDEQKMLAASMPAVVAPLPPPPSAGSLTSQNVGLDNCNSSDLGLDPFQTNSTFFPSTVASTGASSSSAGIISSTGTASSMTLEQKQKLARQQETIKTFHNQQQQHSTNFLEPVKSTVRSNASSTAAVNVNSKDLTSSLMSDWTTSPSSIPAGTNSNQFLSQSQPPKSGGNFSWTSPQQPQIAQGSAAILGQSQQFQVNNNNINSNNNASNIIVGLGQQSQRRSTDSGLSAAPPSANFSNFNSSFSSWNSTNNSQSFGGTLQNSNVNYNASASVSPVMGNWSALDSLLPNNATTTTTSGNTGNIINNNNRVPMNQMALRQPLLGAPSGGLSSGGAATGSGNSLSKDDILDLLS